MTWICYVGIEVSARVQYALLGIEVVMLVALRRSSRWCGSAPDTRAATSIHAVVVVVQPVPHARRSSALADGVLLAVFIYWGWDTAVSVNEETKDRRTPRAVRRSLSTLLLLAIYSLVTVAAQAFAGVGDKGIGLGNPDNAGRRAVRAGPRGLRLEHHRRRTDQPAHPDGPQLGRGLHPDHDPADRPDHACPWRCPRRSPPTSSGSTRGTSRPPGRPIGMGLASIVFYVVLVRLSPNVLGDTVASIGLLIAFYYGMTGFACVWFFRHDLFRSARACSSRGSCRSWAASSSLLAFVRAAIDYAKPDYGTTSWTLPFPPHWQVGGVFLTGIGSLVVGLVLMLVYNAIAPDFFAGRVLRRDTPTPEESRER